MLVDVGASGFTGKDVANALDKASITANKNGIPFDEKSPFVTSGVRLGTPAVTTRGMKEEDMATIADFINAVTENMEDDTRLAEIREQVVAFANRFDLP
jgi:glycine hydroxymethyltransferase